MPALLLTPCLACPNASPFCSGPYEIAFYDTNAAVLVRVRSHSFDTVEGAVSLPNKLAAMLFVGPICALKTALLSLPHRTCLRICRQAGRAGNGCSALALQRQACRWRALLGIRLHRAHAFKLKAPHPGC